MSKTFCIIETKGGHVQNLLPFTKFLRELKDGRHLLEAAPYNKRSNPQNNYYWMMLTQFIQPGLYNEGWREIKTKEDAHVFVADLFLKVRVINETTGEVRDRVKSTTELSKIEFNVYLEEIWQWAAEYLSITIPAPNEQTILSYEI